MSVRKTQADLLVALTEHIGGAHGALLAEQFKQMVLPKLKLSPKAMEEMSDEEFNHSLAKMKAEAPAFIAWLKQQEDLPTPPSAWDQSSN